MKNENHFAGGIAGIIEACIYIFGFIILFTVLQPTIDDTIAGPDRLKFIIANKGIYQTWMLLIYVVFGIVLVPLIAAIDANFRELNSIWVKVTPVFGFIWSGLVIASGMIGVVGIDSIASIYKSDPNGALTSWNTIEVVQNGLGGGVEIIGGLWVFLISITGLKYSTGNKFFNYLGLIVGGAGILTIIPGLKDLGAIFGLTQIVWFLWIGITSVRNNRMSYIK